jgi:hypothetical protein
MPIDRPVPVRRDTKDAPRFFTLSDMRTCIAARHSEDPAWFFAVTATHMAMIVDRHDARQAMPWTCASPPDAISL